MPEQVIISDAGPLGALQEIGELYTLRKRYQQVMKNAIILFYISLLLAFQLSQQELGAGIVDIDLTKVTSLEVYNHKTDEKPFAVIRIMDREGEKSLQAEKPLNWLKPEDLWLDYYIFTFRYLQAEEEWVEVTVNNETGDKKWLKRKAGLEVVKWEVFLVEHTTAIEPLFPTAIKDAPDEQAAMLRKSSKEDCFEAVSVRGQWLRIRTNTVLECNEHKEPVADGWIRWRDDQRLLIEYFLTC